MTNKRVCILGGTGFVGRHLANRLANQGYPVEILTRRRERHRSLAVNPNIRLIETRDLHAAELQRHFSGAFAVINLIGILNESGGSDCRFSRLHAELPGTVATAAAQAAVSRLLHMSALHANVDQGPSRYLQTKGEGEQRAHAASDKGLVVTSFQPSVIYGPDDSFFNRFAALLKLSPLFFPLACPQSRFSPVYVGDVTDAFCTALENESTAGQRLELCGPETYSLKELVEYTCDLLGLKRHIIGLGDGLSRLQARALGLLPGKPFTMDNYLSLQQDSTCTDNALPALGITPTPIAAIVPAYLAGRHSRAHYDAFRQAARRK